MNVGVLHKSNRPVELSVNTGSGLLSVVPEKELQNAVSTVHDAIYANASADRGFAYMATANLRKANQKSLNAGDKESAESVCNAADCAATLIEKGIVKRRNLPAFDHLVDIAAPRDQEHVLKNQEFYNKLTDLEKELANDPTYMELLRIEVKCMLIVVAREIEKRMVFASQAGESYFFMAKKLAYLEKLKQG